MPIDSSGNTIWIIDPDEKSAPPTVPASCAAILAAYNAWRAARADFQKASEVKAHAIRAEDDADKRLQAAEVDLSNAAIYPGGVRRCFVVPEGVLYVGTPGSIFVAPLEQLHAGQEE